MYKAAKHACNYSIDMLSKGIRVMMISRTEDKGSTQRGMQCHPESTKQQSTSAITALTRWQIIRGQVLTKVSGVDVRIERCGHQTER